MRVLLPTVMVHAFMVLLSVDSLRLLIEERTEEFSDLFIFLAKSCSSFIRIWAVEAHSVRTRS